LAGKTIIPLALLSVKGFLEKSVKNKGEILEGDFSNHPPKTSPL
jgi:hypothetical protein